MRVGWADLIRLSAAISLSRLTRGLS